MANLVPLQLDKDTGRIVASDISGTGGGGGGGGDLPVGCFQTCGFIFNQLSVTDTWFVSHNTGLTKGQIQVFDSLNRLIMPDEVMFVDSNSVLILFATATTGKAYLNLIDDIP